MEKIKILNVISGGLKRDGITLSQLDYMKEINKDLFEIDVAAVHNNSEEIINQLTEYGCNVIRFPDRKKQTFKYISKLNKTIKENKYDIIHVHGSSALISVELVTAKRNGVKVRIAHSRNTKTEKMLLHKILKPIFNKSYTFAIACGEEAGKWLFGEKPFTILHNGKDLSVYSYNNNTRTKIREQFKLENKKALATVGNCNNQKNQFFLIDTFENVHKQDPNTHLYLMGDGPNRNKLEEKVKELGLENSVTFLGRVDNANEIINAMDAMLLPSFYEGLPNVVLEWQANGIKSFISDTITRECKVSDLVEYIPINNGVTPWTEKIMNLEPFNEANRIENSKAGCQGLIDNSFEIKSNVKKLEDIYISEFKKEN